MSTHGSREQEWQFAASGLEAARDWIARQPAEYSVRRFKPRATLELRDTYFDSADWMIFRAGFALRLRHSRDEAGAEHTELTLKSLTAARPGGFASRTEISEPVAGNDLSGVLRGNTPIGDHLRALIGDRALAPLFHARTRRERQQLLEADTDLALAEIDLDHTSLETPGGATRELTRVEVECLNAEPAVLAPLVEQLRAAAHLEPANESKFRAGLSVAGLDPVTAWQAPARKVDARQPFDASVLTVLARYFAAVLQREPRVRLGEMAAVHEMRVAARHVDVFLKTFTKHLPPWAVRSRRVVRGLVKALGTVRDGDVQLAFLAGGDVADSAAAIEVLRTRIATDRAAAHRALLVRLDSADVREWIDEWRRAFDAAPPAAAASAVARTGRVARDLVRAQARKLRKRAGRIDANSAADEYHEVRIRAKRLRYVLDAFAELYGEAADAYSKALSKLQTVLGDYHDAAVRAVRFETLARSELPAAASFAMGRLVERDAQALEECRARFPKAYRRIRRRRWRALRESMDRVAETP